MIRTVIIIVFSLWFYQKLQTMEINEVINLVVGYLNNGLTSLKNILIEG
jgi:hypothetical protein